VVAQVAGHGQDRRLAILVAAIARYVHGIRERVLDARPVLGIERE
jgi:hypothetical protein